MAARRLAPTLLLLAVIAGAAPVGGSPANAQAQASGAQTGDEQMILAVTINGQRIDDGLLAIRKPDGFYIPAAALAAARVTLGRQAVTIPGPGADYVALSSLPGVAVDFDGAMQELNLTVDATAFAGQRLELQPTLPVQVEASQGGAYANYDAVLQGGTDYSYFATLLDGGAPVFGGSFLTSGILRADEDSAEIVRLETAYVRDFSEELVRVKFGDAISNGGSWGRPAHFGGVQFATNFAVQPGYVSFPTANFAGQAALPSTVDVFVNDVLRYRGSIDQGPFELNQIPALTGGGDARVVVTDALGRQQAVTLPFYVSPRLLREGVSDYSYELGLLRKGYGLESNQYDDPYAAATHRYGLTDGHTIEGHAEATPDRQAIGGSLTSAVPGIGELHGEAAVSNGTGGAGWLAGLGYSRNVDPWTFAVRQRWQSDNFDEGGVVFSVSGAPLLSETLASVSRSFGAYGNVALSFAHQTYDGLDAATVATVNWSLPVTESVFLNAYALHARQDVADTTVGLTLTVLLGNSTTGSADMYRRGDRSSGTIQARHAPVANGEWGYGASVSRGEIERAGADVTRRTFGGDFTAAVDRYEGGTAGRLTASGGVALVGEKIFLARRIDDAFGVVSVPGHAGVTVTRENQPVGETDADGDLFLPKLLSNYPNRIGIETADLPIDAEIERLETVVTPGYRGIAAVTFEARQSQARLIRMLHRDGKPVAPGVEVVRLSDGTVFRSGFDGEIYLEGDAGDRFEAHDPAGLCRFTLSRLSMQDGRLTGKCEGAA